MLSLHGIHPTVRETGRVVRNVRVRDEVPQRGPPFAQPARRAYPDRALCVRGDVVHLACRKARRIARLVAQMLYCSAQATSPMSKKTLDPF